MQRIVVCILAAMVSSAAWGKEIPLKEIWGFNIAGTSDVKELVPPPKKDPQSAEDFINSSVVEQTAQLLGHRKVPAEGRKAGDGFIVAGVGKEALERAREVLAGKEKSLKEISAEGEFSLVIYTYFSGRSFCLDDVQVDDGEITVAYHLMAHELMSSSAHFALIPLPKLPPGDVNVVMKRSDDTGPAPIIARLAKVPAERIVSGSFKFRVIADAKIKE
ncbi:hypothetical protein [Lacipirellula sp.]|uniref:hypothetical protein n=1 Tax=Lacipirellula sp. TaxID=2691419 RepID=UPI003D0AA1CB